jgi:serine/threonine protein kinase/tetratricopeptide (TPR) repeat protein
MGQHNGTVSSAVVDSAFGRLVEELTARLQAGEAVDWRHVAEEHPDHADELAAVRPALEMLGHLSGARDADLSGLAPTADDGLAGVLGDFRLLREVGRGGMGVVYEAEQISLGRRVALKVLPYAGALDAKQLQRFKNEAKAAASLKHEHIVQVHAIGCERGVHFYAMEFIDGQTLAQVITEINQAEELNHRGTEDTEKKEKTGPWSSLCSLCLCGNKSSFFRCIAELIADAADALEHAHALGIVHRDVKPGNLLLDGDGKVYVSDFGLARFGTDAGLTISGDLLGTLRYMAPEQALAKHGLADHRVDVYGLGCTLYELLTGKPAVDGEDRQEILSRIAFGEPTPARKVDKAIPVELETITVNALAKEPAERYATAGEMADDLRRFLTDRPIQARPSSPMQYARKWARRHRAVVWAMGISAALVMTTALIALTVSNRLVTGERDEKVKALGEARENYDMAARRLEQVKKGIDVLGAIFQNLDVEAEEKDGKPLRVLLAEQLGQAENQLEGEAVGESIDVAYLQTTLGNSLRQLGYYENAIEMLNKSRATYVKSLGLEHPVTLIVSNNLGMAYMSAGQLDLALPLFEETLKLRKAIIGAEHPQTLSSMDNLANCYSADGRLQQAVALFEETLKLRKATLGLDHNDTITSMNNLALAYKSIGRSDLAIPLCEETRRRLTAKLGPDHDHTLGCMNNLASAYSSVGRLDLAVRLWEEVFKLNRAKSGVDHPHTLVCMSNLAGGYVSTGNLELALPLLEEALRLKRVKLGLDHPATLLSMNDLAVGYKAAGKVDSALPLLEETLKLRRGKLGPDHPDTLQTLNNLAATYQAVGKVNLAVPLSEEACEKTKAKLGPDHPLSLTAAVNLAVSYLAAKQPAKALPLFQDFLERQRKRLGDNPALAELLAGVALKLLQAEESAAAEPILRECLAIREKHNPNAWNTFNTRSALGGSLLGQQKYAESEPLLLSGFEGMKQRETQIPLEAKVRLIEAMERLVRLYESTNDKDKAAEWRKKLDAARDAAKPPTKESR